MSNSVYTINKGINKSIEFKGLKAQYIWYFGAGVIALLILFAILYIIGINSFVCIGIIFIGGTVLTIKVYALSNTYGEYGMLKKMARRSIPNVIRSKSRSAFLNKK
jgi:predicted lysophospholipase L1 biosynthesis ABC-type transport system permease subunit